VIIAPFSLTCNVLVCPKALAAALDLELMNQSRRIAIRLGFSDELDALKVRLFRLHQATALYDAPSH
jgi:hypothetical protein